MRALVAAAAILLPTPTAPTLLPMVVVSPQAIVQVVCFGKGSISAGTAFRVGPDGEMLSVNHVTSAPNCYISGKPIGHVWKDPAADFSMIDGDEGPYLTIDCGGFVKGRKYLAVGFARGRSPVTVVELTGTGEHDGGEALLDGMFVVVPGQSGGPIIDEDTGRVVGTVNAENFEEGLSWSVELKDTPVCTKAIA